MKTVILFVVLFFADGFSCLESIEDIKFINDFFALRNGAYITISSCWGRRKLKLWFEEIGVNMKNSNYLAIWQNKSQISSLRKYSHNDYIIFNLKECISKSSILDQVNSAGLFAYPLKFVVLVNSSDSEALSAKVNNYALLPSSEFWLVEFRKELAFLRQPYKTDRLNESTWENYGNWSLKGGLFEYYPNIPTPQRRSNLARANLAVVLVIYENDTWNHLTDYRYPGIDTFTKQDWGAMRCVLEHLNINYTLTAVDSYGYYNAVTGEFDGLVHEIQSGKADVSGCSIYFTEDRYRAVDLIKMGNPLALRFLVKKPSTSYIKNIFWITFTQQVWIAIFVIMLIFTCIVKIILDWESANKKDANRNKYTVSDVTLIALEALCQQGTTTEPRSFSGRTITLIFFASLMFIYVSYSANIVVLLQSSTKINNLEELLESRIEVGGWNIHYMKNYFEAPKKGILRKLYLQKIFPDHYYPFEVGMQKLRDGNFAFHVSLQAAYEFIQKNFTNYEICGLQELPGYIEANHGYIAIPKRSPYKDLFKVAILRVDEYGLQRRTNLRIIMKPRCFSSVASFKSVGIYDCYQVFCVWIFGSALALLVFVFEIAAERIMSRQQSFFSKQLCLKVSN